MSTWTCPGCKELIPQSHNHVCDALASTETREHWAGATLPDQAVEAAQCYRSYDLATAQLFLDLASRLRALEDVVEAAPALTFDQLAEMNRRRCERWHPGFPNDDVWTIADWSNAVCGEAGELANVIKKLRRLETGTDPGPDDPPKDRLLEMACDEMADVVCYVDLLCTRLGFDLGAAVADKFNRVSERQGFPERLGAALAALDGSTDGN